MVTIVEVETKKTVLETTVTTALEAAKILAPGTGEFDEAYGRYLSAKAALVKIPGELIEAKRAENAAAIQADCMAIGAAISELVVGLGLAVKLGEPVISVVWVQDPAGIDGVFPEPEVRINPRVQVKSTGKSTETKVSGRTMIGYPDGTRKSPTKFVLDHDTVLTAEERTKATYKSGFTPHVLVDSKPKFDTFCAAHKLTGYTLIAPGKVETSPTA